MDVRPPVVVLPPESDGGRRMMIHGARMGTAYSLFDVLDFLHRVGLPAEDRRRPRADRVARRRTVCVERHDVAVASARADCAHTW